MNVIRLAFAAAILWAMAVPASAQELYGTLKKIRDSKTFTIGFREASFPFAYYDEQKKPVGFSVELCNRIGDALKEQFKIPDLAVRYLPVNAQTRIPLLTNGTIDIECGSTTNNLVRQQQVDFSYSVYVTGGRLLVSKASGIKEIEDINGKVVGVSSGSSNERVLKTQRLQARRQSHIGDHLPLGRGLSNVQAAFRAVRYSADPACRLELQAEFHAGLIRPGVGLRVVPR